MTVTIGKRTFDLGIFIGVTLEYDIKRERWEWGLATDYVV